MEPAYDIDTMTTEATALGYLDLEMTSALGANSQPPVWLFAGTRHSIDCEQKVANPVTLLPMLISAAPGVGVHRHMGRQDDQLEREHPVSGVALVGRIATQDFEIVITRL